MLESLYIELRIGVLDLYKNNRFSRHMTSFKKTIIRSIIS